MGFAAAWGLWEGAGIKADRPDGLVGRQAERSSLKFALKLAGMSNNIVFMKKHESISTRD